MRGDLEYNDNAAQNYRPGQYHTADKIQKIRQVHRIALKTVESVLIDSVFGWGGKIFDCSCA